MKRILQIRPRKLLTLLYSTYLKNRFYTCGRGLRAHPPLLIYNPQKMEFGENVSIGQDSWLNCVENTKNERTLKIGKGCIIGRFAHINAYEEVILGENVLTGERIHISDCSHIYSDPSVPIMNQGAEFLGPVVIKKGAWIGSGAVILPGVTIGQNAVVGANAVVNQDVPDNYIAVGVPARILSKQTKKGNDYNKGQ